MPYFQAPNVHNAISAVHKMGYQDISASSFVLPNSLALSCHYTYRHEYTAAIKLNTTVANCMLIYQRYHKD